MSAPQRGFNIAHQKACINVDIRQKTLNGWTELTVVPTSLELTQIVLDARRLHIERCTLNGADASFTHSDALSQEHQYPRSWTVRNHDRAAKPLKSLHEPTGEGPGELRVTLPPGVRVSEPSEASFVAPSASREKTYEPLTLRVHYRLRTDVPNEGLNFVGSSGAEPHCYTTHSPIGQATSCWLPCLDGLWSLSTWELEVRVPQFLDRQNVDSEILVIGNVVAPVEHIDPANSHYKIVKFAYFSPISSQHLGFAVGPFKPVHLVMVEHGAGESTTESTSASTSTSANPGANASANGNASVSGISAETPRVTGNPALPMSAYALPSKEHLIENTCRPLVMAMDYLTRDFGSFPYDSYSLCFVSDYIGTTTDACALTICSDTLLYSPDLVEPRFADCHLLVRGMAAQYCGVSILPASANDIWVTEGIAGHLTNLFIRKLMGNNEYRFRIRRANDELCREDIDRPPIGAPKLRFPLGDADLQFIRLKAPLVLFILDRRMTKTDRSLGISRVLTKLFLQSMSGDLRSQLSTAHFVRQCEKVAHHRLTKFFDEWVYGSGFPVFRITQRFNKKRLCIEMGIGQVHSRELPQHTLRDDTVLTRAVTHLDIVREKAPPRDSEPNTTTGPPSVSIDPPHFRPANHFSGPMTIRIHEANGTPYEHVVELREQLTKIDIPYNTKYKRLRRNQKFRRDVSAAPANSGDGDQLINCLGDVLMSEEEVGDWKFVDWGDGGDGDDELMFNEAFEWLRADADFEWLGRFFVSQPDYMYASQLQQDQDVVAQYEAVRFFGRQQPHPLYYTVLTRTLMDRRYFYGVRVSAANELARMAVPQLQFAGMHLLLRAFRHLYCFPPSNLPKANDFSDVPAYFVQKAIPRALSRIRDPGTGRCPPEIGPFILDLIRYNENSENAFSDCFYLASLLESATETQLPSDNDRAHAAASVLAVWEHPPAAEYLTNVVAEINKSRRLDQWVPSFRHIVTTTSIRMEERLGEAGYGAPRMDKLLLSAQPGEPAEVRLAAWRALLNLGGYHYPAVMRHWLDTVLHDEQATIRWGLVALLPQLVGHVAINGLAPAPDASGEEDLLVRRQQALARQHIHSIIPLLRETLGNVEPLQTALWPALVSNRVGSLARKYLLEVCDILYEPSPQMLVVMKCPPLYQLSLRRRRDFFMVAKYRSVLRRPKRPATDTPVEAAEPVREPPKIKLKLR